MEGIIILTQHWLSVLSKQDWGKKATWKKCPQQMSVDKIHVKSYVYFVFVLVFVVSKWLRHLSLWLNITWHMSVWNRRSPRRWFSNVCRCVESVRRSMPIGTWRCFISYQHIQLSISKFRKLAVHFIVHSHFSFHKVGSLWRRFWQFSQANLAHRHG